MAGSIAVTPRFKFFDNAGAPASGYLVYTYASKTTTPKTTWQDFTQATANTNPITLDANGECLLWIDPAQAYTFVLKTPGGATVRTTDDISGSVMISGITSDMLNATSVGFQQLETGAKKRTVADKNQEGLSLFDFLTDAQKTEVHARTAVTDLSSYFNAAAIVSLYAGRKISLPVGTYAISNTVEILNDAAVFEGESNGGYVFSPTNYLNEGVVIKWIGAAGGTMMKVGSTGTVKGGALRNIQFDGNSLAGTALHPVSVSNFAFENLTLKNSTIYGLDLTSRDSDTDLNSVYNCAFRNIMIVPAANADGIYAGTTSGSGQHPAFCTFDNIHVTTGGTGNGINLYEADDNVFINVVTSRLAGGTGESLIFQRNSTAGNTFIGFHAGKVDGVDPKIWAKSGSTGNYMIVTGVDYNIAPTVDAGAELFYVYTGKNSLPNQSRQSVPATKFPNVSIADAMAMDWYEEGSFTPSLSFQTPGNLAVAYSTQTGTFTRQGNRVTADITLITSSFTHSTASGQLRINGLPYNANAQAIGNMQFQGITKASYTQFSPASAAGSTALFINASGSGQSYAPVNTADVPSGGSIIARVTIEYEAQ